MGVDLWIVRHEFLYGHLAEEEYDFIMDFFPQSDDGTFFIDLETLENLKKEYPDECAKVSEMITAIERALKKENATLSLAIF